MSASIEHHFETEEQQRDAATLGMWVFLATEVLFFGGLFMSYTFLRWSHEAAVEASSRHLELALGSINTALLLTSSFVMAAGVHFTEKGRYRMAAAMLALTALMGIGFLAVKGTEYHAVISDGHWPGSRFHALGLSPAAPGPEELFFWLYFVMTGLHALHVLAGVVVLATIAVMLERSSKNARSHPASVSRNTVHNAGLYWHFVDIVWVFLFPLLYLAGHW